MILNLVKNCRIREGLDLELAKVMDFTVLKGYLSYPRLAAACKMAEKYKFRSICIPSRWLDTFRPVYPDMKFSTVVNYPFGYHSSDVVLRELQGVVGSQENWDNLEIDFVVPKDAVLFWDDYAEWHSYVPLRMILPWSSYSFIHSMPDVYPGGLNTIQLGTSFDFETPPDIGRIQLMIDSLKKKGYIVKVSGVTNPEDARKYLEMGASLLGCGPRLAPIQTKIYEVVNDIPGDQ